MLMGPAEHGMLCFSGSITKKHMNFRKDDNFRKQ